MKFIDLLKVLNGSVKLHITYKDPITGDWKYTEQNVRQVERDSTYIWIVESITLLNGNDIRVKIITR